MMRDVHPKPADLGNVLLSGTYSKSLYLAVVLI